MWIDSSHTGWLLEDFHSRVVPYRHDPEPYVLSTEGAESREVDRALSLGGESGLDGFLRAVASRLLTRHEAWLEVVFEEGREHRAPFTVVEVDGVERTPDGALVQQLPPADELPAWYRDRDGWGAALELDPQRMVHTRLPDSYSSALLMQVVRDLAEIELNPFPDWAMDQWPPGRQDPTPYDANKATRTRQLRLAQAALPLGWTAREIYLGPNRAVSDYYHDLRELRFLHFMASLRSCAEEALRQVLVLAGERCGFTASVTAFGVHTPREVEARLQQFKDGALPFAGLNDILFEIGPGLAPQQRSVL